MRREWRIERGAACARSDERGASLAEFALVLPILLMILFGIIEFGVAFSRSQAIEAAAREGGRLASLSATSSADVQERVNQTLGLTTFDSTPEVTIVPAGGCAGREGQSVTVTVQAMHRLTVPFVMDQEMLLTGQSVFRCEA
ncbi:MAG: TadE family protein [Actinomycetota bacterium]